MKKPKVKKMTTGEFKEARKALFESYGGVQKKKKFKPLTPGLMYDEDRGSGSYRSMTSSKPAVCGKNTVMSPENLAKESQETRDEIIRKSQRLVPLYSKGPVQFMTDEADPHDAGRKK